MAKINSAYLMLGWLLGRFVMGKRALIGAEDLAPEVPNTPELAVAYIYGTPGMNAGNATLGLRSEDIVVLYDGVVCPALPSRNKREYPYAMLSLSVEDQTPSLYFMTESAFITTSGTHFNTASPCTYQRYDYDVSADDWVLYGTYTSDDVGCYGMLSTTKLVWSDHDIPNPDGTIYLDGHEPMPVTTGIIGHAYGYDSKSKTPVVLPPLPEYDKDAYPYAVMEYLNNDEHRGDGALAHFRATNSSWTYYGRGGFYPMNISDASRLECFISIWDFNEGWREPSYGEYRGHIGDDGVTSRSWANHNIKQYSGSWVVASWAKSPDPVPVYDTKIDYIWYSYNGEILPVLPKRDTTSYPCDCICVINGKPKLFCTEHPLYLDTQISTDETGELRLHFVDKVDGDVTSYATYIIESGSWIYDREHATENAYMAMPSNSKILWTNTAIVTEDGSEYMAATEPVGGYHKST